MPGSPNKLVFNTTAGKIDIAYNIKVTSNIRLMLLSLMQQVPRESSMRFFMRRKIKHVLQGQASQQH